MRRRAVLHRRGRLQRRNLPRRECDDGDPCTVDGCDEVADSCFYSYESSPCDDGDPCTGDDVCTEGLCAGTLIPSCGETSTTTSTTVTTSTTLEECPVCGNVFPADCKVAASDALGVLQSAVGQRECALAVCDYTGDGKVTAPDALGVLRDAVGLAANPQCPAPG